MLLATWRGRLARAVRSIGLVDGERRIVLWPDAGKIPARREGETPSLQQRLLDRIDRPSDAALAVDDLSALGRSHAGAETVFAGLFTFRHPVRIVHRLPRVCLYCVFVYWRSKTPSRAMIPARTGRGKGFLTQGFLTRVSRRKRSVTGFFDTRVGERSFAMALLFPRPRVSASSFKVQGGFGR